MKAPWLWVEPQEVPQKEIPGMIEPSERRMLYWAGKRFAKGRGTIAEVGSFVGCSTYCLARGLQDNPQRGEALVHSHDRFLIDDDNANYLSFLPSLSKDFRGSFYNLYRENIDEVIDYVRPYQGDVFEKTWHGEPIEVMFLNPVSRELVAHVYDTFFPNIIDGGLVVFQDYFNLRSHYLSALTAVLADDLIFLGQAETSGVFMVRDASVFKSKFNDVVPPDVQIPTLLELLIEHMGGRSTPIGQILSTQKMFLDAKLNVANGGVDEFHALGLSFLSPLVKDYVVQALSTGAK